MHYRSATFWAFHIWEDNFDSISCDTRFISKTDLRKMCEQWLWVEQIQDKRASLAATRDWSWCCQGIAVYPLIKVCCLHCIYLLSYLWVGLSNGYLWVVLLNLLLISYFIHKWKYFSDINSVSWDYKIWCLYSFRPQTKADNAPHRKFSQMKEVKLNI